MHTTDIDEKAEKSKKMQSITQMNDFEEFMHEAMLSEKQFVAEKQNAVVISQSSFTEDKQKQIYTEEERLLLIEKLHRMFNLSIPRR
jgi:hypothetical protein